MCLYFRPSFACTILYLVDICDNNEWKITEQTPNSRTHEAAAAVALLRKPKIGSQETNMKDEQIAYTQYSIALFSTFISTDCGSKIRREKKKLFDVLLQFSFFFYR